MLVTYYYNPKNPKGLPHNREEYGEPSALKTIELKELLAACSGIGEDVGKMEAGQMYAFIADKFYRKETIVEELIQTDGACLDDVDELTDDERECIWSHWNEIIKKRPNLQTIWQSYSRNFHVCFWTECLNAAEYYEQEILGLIYFAVAVKEICGITLKDKSYGVKANLDVHNSSISQRFFLNRITKDTVLWNDDAVPSNFPELSVEEKEECRKYWPQLIYALEHKDSITETHINKKVDYEINSLSKDSNKIEYIEHRKRWNVYTCFAELFEDKEKADSEWEKFSQRIPETNKHTLSFYIQEPERNQWFKIRHPFPNFEILSRYGYSIHKKEDEIDCVKKEHWIVESKEKIIDFIKEHRRSEIIAPTGVGKTTLINGDVIEDKILDDCFSLAKELNGIVLVPFNVTNKLYYNLIEINSSWSGDIRSDRQYVMVWDQALKYWDCIKDRTLIIDEAHCLFLDRTYRDVAVKLMNKIKEDDCKIVLFTATPSGEGEELSCDILKFTNERDVISINFIKVNTVDAAQLGAIKKCIENESVDRIVLFDDMHAKKIYENLMIEGKYINDISYIRADTKDSDDFTYLREKELLNKKLTICTCVAFNGLNFKNDNENVVVITSYRNGDTTAAKLIQESGRIRNSKVTVIVYYDGRERESTLEDRIEKASIMNDAVIKMQMPDSLLSYDRRLLKDDIVAALRRIEAKLIEDSNLDKIVSTLVETGYFIVNKKDFSNDEREKGDRLILAIKKKQSEEFIEDLLNDSFGAYKEGSYKDIWKKKIDSIIDNDGYTGIDIDTFKNLIDKKNKNTLIETVIAKVERIIRVSVLSEIDWNNYVSKIEILKNALKKDIDKRDLAKSYKKNTEIRNKYKDKIIVNEDSTIDLNPVIKDLFEEIEEQCNKERINRENHSKKKVKSIEDNIVFDSMEEAASYYNKSRASMTKWKKQGKLIEIE